MSIDAASQLASEFGRTELNEADTRHRVIDVILHDVLAWPRCAVDCERYSAPGYMDYCLVRPDGTPILIIEAKKSGYYFSLPAGFNDEALTRKAKLRALLTDDKVSAAIDQVRTYALKEGAEYAAITNGAQWVFFKTFQRGKVWEDLHAIVVSGVEYFSKQYVDAQALLNYKSVTADHSLARHMDAQFLSGRELFFPKEKITSFGFTVNQNSFAPTLRPLAERYFGNLDEKDEDFANHCYVSDRTYDSASRGLERLALDAITPYFKDRGVEEIVESGRGGTLRSKVVNAAHSGAKGSVIVLFGGKGAGKSTFLRRILLLNPPAQIKNNSKVAIVDLLSSADNPEQVYADIWTQLIAALDDQGILQSDRAELLSLFSDKYELAKKQSLSGLSEESEAYNVALNEKVNEWLDDHVYCTQRLIEYHRRRHRGVIVVIDNTDQLSGASQDRCFTTAQEIASKFQCLGSL